MKLSGQKNAIAGGLVGGIGGGQLVLELLDAFTNLHPDARQAALITGAVSTITLLAARPLRYLWQHGVRGSWRRLLDGSADAEPARNSGSDPAPGATILTEADRQRLLTEADVQRIAEAVDARRFGGAPLPPPAPQA